jgi:hypothetical protein
LLLKGFLALGFYSKDSLIFIELPSINLSIKILSSLEKSIGQLLYFKKKKKYKKKKIGSY